MEKFQITFSFEHGRHEAEVVMIKSKDHTQYTISPKDEDLFLNYGTQVIHEFAGKPMEFAFPGSTDKKVSLSKALAAGLKHYLEKKQE
jgi:hypothetical protein